MNALERLNYLRANNAIEALKFIPMDKGPYNCELNWDILKGKDTVKSITYDDDSKKIQIYIFHNLIRSVYLKYDDIGIVYEDYIELKSPHGSIKIYRGL